MIRIDLLTDIISLIYYKDQKKSMNFAIIVTTINKLIKKNTIAINRDQTEIIPADIFDKRS